MRRAVRIGDRGGDVEFRLSVIAVSPSVRAACNVAAAGVGRTAASHSGRAGERHEDRQDELPAVEVVVPRPRAEECAAFSHSSAQLASGTAAGRGVRRRPARARRAPGGRASREAGRGSRDRRRRRRARATLSAKACIAPTSIVRQLGEQRAQARGRVSIAVLLDEQDGAAQAAARRARAASATSSSSAASAPAPHRRLRSRPAASGARSSRAAARADRRQQPARRVADEQEQRARRRLLEDLQEGVGGVRVHVVGRIDDGDRASPLRPPVEPKKRDGAPDLVDRELGPVALALRRPTAAAGRGGSGARRPATLRNAGWSSATARSVAAGTAGVAGSGWAKSEAGEAVGERRLADALRPAEQPGVVHAAGAIGVEQRLLGAGVAEPDAAAPPAPASRRARRGGDRPRSRPRAMVTPPRRGAGRRPPARSPSATVVLRRGRVDDDAALRLARRRWRGRPAAGARGAPSASLSKRSGPSPSRPGARGRARRPISAGMSRMSVRSGRSSPTATRSSASSSSGVDAAVAP